MDDLRFHLVNQILLGLLGGKAGDAFQHFDLAELHRTDFLRFLVNGGVLLAQRLFLLFYALYLPV